MQEVNIWQNKQDRGNGTWVELVKINAKEKERNN